MRRDEGVGGSIGSPRRTKERVVAPGVTIAAPLGGLDQTLGTRLHLGRDLAVALPEPIAARSLPLGERALVGRTQRAEVLTLEPLA